jgi:hypothetical protein
VALPISGTGEGAWEAIGGLKARSGRSSEETAADLNRVFRAGSPPRDVEGRHDGMLVLPTQGPLDGLGRFLSSIWMPWLGKRFDPQAATGDNLFVSASAPSFRVMWPGYSFRRVDGGLLSAFDFRTYLAPGIADPDRQVLKIDYDIDANPTFLIRSVMDELVEVGPRTYLGKVHLRRGDGWKMMGYFSLRPAERDEPGPGEPGPAELTVWRSAEVAEEPRPARRRRTRKPAAEPGQA